VYLQTQGGKHECNAFNPFPSAFFSFKKAFFTVKAAFLSAAKILLLTE